MISQERDVLISEQTLKFIEAVRTEEVMSEILSRNIPISLDSFDPELAALVSEPNFLKGVRRIIFGLGRDIGKW